MQYRLLIIAAFAYFGSFLPTMAQSQCPDDFVAFRNTGAPLTCSCLPIDNPGSNVWGMDVYTEDSNICLAALHAGLIGKQGGAVTVLPQPGRRTYAGVTRNGISSSNHGSMDGSFSFAMQPAAPPPTTAAAPTMAPAPMPAAPAASAPSMLTFTQCPDDFVSFRNTTAPLTCSCLAIDNPGSNVWGMDIYTEDSNICLAAMHAGLISRQGGNVTVLPQPGRPAYAGVTRNGISSSNNGSMDGSFSFNPVVIVPPPAPVVMAQPQAPVQQPIAVTLQQTGQVQLYIHFGTGSATLFDDSYPVLTELLGALRSNPTIGLSLIGHTDAVGSSDYNMSLSAKRAEAVKFWLVQNGVLPSRLRTSGRGFSEPLDSNTTDYGRAVNRRVQAIRMQ
jgi:outer membrane protein OmpA-like peptidoglycan-associated protein